MALAYQQGELSLFCKKLRLRDNYGKGSGVCAAERMPAHVVFWEIVSKNHQKRYVLASLHFSEANLPKIDMKKVSLKGEFAYQRDNLSI